MRRSVECVRDGRPFGTRAPRPGFDPWRWPKFCQAPVAGPAARGRAGSAGQGLAEARAAIDKPHRGRSKVSNQVGCTLMPCQTNADQLIVGGGLPIPFPGGAGYTRAKVAYESDLCWNTARAYRREVSVPRPSTFCGRQRVCRSAKARRSKLVADVKRG